MKKNFKLNKFILFNNYLIKNNLYNRKTYLYLIKVLKNLKDFRSSILVLPIKKEYFDNELKLSNFFKKFLKFKHNSINILETEADTKKLFNFLNFIKLMMSVLFLILATYI